MSPLVVSPRTRRQFRSRAGSADSPVSAGRPGQWSGRRCAKCPGCCPRRGRGAAPARGCPSAWRAASSSSWQPRGRHGWASTTPQRHRPSCQRESESQRGKHSNDEIAPAPAQTAQTGAWAGPWAGQVRGWVRREATATTVTPPLRRGPGSAHDDSHVFSSVGTALKA